jgi:hypothetical protein
MIERMSISGLGPHAEFTAEFNPSGRTLVTGPSESGKSFLLEAITFCLWGRTHGSKFATEAIHDGMPKASVEILLDSGRLIRRSVTQSSGHRRSITMGEDTQTYTTEAAFAAALGALGQDPEALRLVVVPFEWVKLVEGNARPFRDVLTRILPPADVGAEVARIMAEKGYWLDVGEGERSEKEVMGLRSDARKARDEASGRLQAAEERLAALTATRPKAEDSGAVDPAVLEAVQKWAEYDRLAGTNAARIAAQQALKSWEERAASLGDEPPWDARFDAAVQRLAMAQRTVQNATQVYQQAYGQHQAALAQAQQFQGFDPSICPTCQRPGWEQGKAVAQQMQTYLAQLQTAFEQATAQYQAANAELQAATALANAAREAELQRKAWTEAKKQLGPKPVVPELPPGATEPPPVPRPDPEAAARAQSSLRETAALEGAIRQWQANFDAAQAAVARETERVEATTKALDRLTELLEAVRVAPSTVAAQQAMALGDLGPVTLTFGDNPAVTVQIDGRPWWLASRGRQVVADTFLRAAIRRAMDKEWLPIVVDNVQDVGGQSLPDVPGPVILLQTTDGKGLSVRRK